MDALVWVAFILFGLWGGYAVNGGYRMPFARRTEGAGMPLARKRVIFTTTSVGPTTFVGVSVVGRERVSGHL